MLKLLNLPKPPSRRFAASDPIAIGAMHAALDADLAIPKQVGLIGVGAHQYSKYLRVPLSTIEQQRPQIGREATRMLVTLCSEESHRSQADPAQTSARDPRLFFPLSGSR
jgi:LacI family transcriptional regulator